MSKLRLVPSAGGAAHEIDGSKVVGRDASADVMIDDASVSRRHARIAREGGVWTVADQASANGTFINGQRVTEAGLRQGQTLRFGDVSFKVEIEGGEDDLAATRLGVARPVPPPPPPASMPTPPVVPSGDDSPTKGRSPAVWVGGCCGCLLLLGIVVVVLGLFGAIAIPGLARKPKDGTSTPAPAERLGLRLETSGATKSREGKQTKIEVMLTVTGYGTRPSGTSYEFDLQEDLLTMNAKGVRMDDLSKEEIERRQSLTSSAEGEPQVFTSTLKITEARPGRYSIRLTITDHLTGTVGVKEVPFTLP